MFKVSVQDLDYLDLINYGLTVHKKKQGFFHYKILKKKRINNWLLIPGKVRRDQVLK